jgi:hypothetical protein
MHNLHNLHTHCLVSYTHRMALPDPAGGVTPDLGSIFNFYPAALVRAANQRVRDSH